MSANVEITDTFDQWRVKTNEVLVATQTDGSSNFVKLTNTTNSTSNTTGSIISAGGIGIAKSAVIGENFTVHGDIDFKGTTNLDNVDIDGTVQIDGTVTVGVNGTGHDVQFFGDSAGQHLLWDQSADELALVGDSKLSFHDAAGGENIVASSDGHLEINSGTTLDITTPTVNVNATTVDFDANVIIHSTLTVNSTTALVGTNLPLLFRDTGLSIGSPTNGTLDIAADTILEITAPTMNVISTTVDFDANVIIHSTLTVNSTTALVGTNLPLLFRDTGLSIGSPTNGTLDIAADTILEITAPTMNVISTTVDIDATTVDIDANVAIHSTVSANSTVVLMGTTKKLLFRDTGLSLGSPTNGTLDIAADTILEITAPTTNVIATTAVDFDTPAITANGTFTIGVNGTGHDVQFFGDTAGSHMIWDESADELALTAASKLSFHDAAGGENIVATSDGHLEINSGTTLDITAPTVDINASTTVNVDGATQLSGTLTVGVNDTGYDVTLFGAAAGAAMIWDQSEDSLLVRGATADAAGSSGRIVLQTAQVAVADGDILGRLDFQAPLETQGSDGALVTASIFAEADATFTATVNHTDLVFTTASDGAATEKFRIDSTGQATFADGAIDVNIASHDGTNGLALGGTVVTATAANLNLVTGAGTLKEVGKESIWVPANAMRPTVSNGCAAGADVETTAGRPDMFVLDFDKDADEFAQFAVAFPKQWNLGTVTFQVFWSGIAATSDCDWSVQGVAMNDNQTIDVAYGTAVVVTDNVQGAVEELMVSAESGALTIAGTAADNDLCYFRIGRDVSGDAMAGDARLHGIKIFFTTDAANDA